MSDEDWAKLEWVAERRNVGLSDVIRTGSLNEYEAELRKVRAEERAAKKRSGA
jgi:hypothetical protein